MLLMYVINGIYFYSMQKTNEECTMCTILNK